MVFSLGRWQHQVVCFFPQNRERNGMLKTRVSQTTTGCPMYSGVWPAALQFSPVQREFQPKSVTLSDAFHDAGIRLHGAPNFCTFWSTKGQRRCFPLHNYSVQSPMLKIKSPKHTVKRKTHLEQKKFAKWPTGRGAPGKHNTCKYNLCN